MHSEKDGSGGTTGSSINLAFLGNSMLYYNDCPRLVEQMLNSSRLYIKVHQNSCLRGGASIASLWTKGNGMQEKFSSRPVSQRAADRSSSSGATSSSKGGGMSCHQYDTGAPTVQSLLQQQDQLAGETVVIVNDQTQAPAREATREATVKALRTKYVPLLEQLKNSVKVVLIHTPAYQYPDMLGTSDIGDFDSFTDRLKAGYEVYRTAIASSSHKIECHIAPVGEAYRWLRNNDRALWSKLYCPIDNFHLSPHGTWLQACVLFCTITKRPPPPYQAAWWDASRYMRPASAPPLPLPTAQEAKTLATVACHVSGVSS
jgi:hypothetical protein